MTWRDAASVRINLKVPATQRHHRERAVSACWLAISQVQFLYGLPTQMQVVFHFTSLYIIPALFLNTCLSVLN